MTKLPVISASKLIRKLMKVFKRYQGKGGYRTLVRIGDGKSQLVIIPMRDPIPKGTLISLIKQTGLFREEFIKLIK
ncbi:MAG: type II toxin-antitoxin system HicA family toxin [Candidatus Heimdallarchaeaceae archaeon]